MFCPPDARLITHRKGARWSNDAPGQPALKGFSLTSAIFMIITTITIIMIMIMIMIIIIIIITSITIIIIVIIIIIIIFYS